MRGSGEIQRREERGSDEDWRRREDEGKIGKGRANCGMLSVLEGSRKRDEEIRIRKRKIGKQEGVEKEGETGRIEKKRRKLKGKSKS